MRHFFVVCSPFRVCEGRRPPFRKNLAPLLAITAAVASVWLPRQAVAEPPVASLATASAGPLVAEPQHALLVSSPTNKRRIWLESLEPTQLLFRDAPGTEPRQSLPARTGRRLAVELVGGDVFAVNPRTGTFDRLVPLTGRFAGDAAAESESTLHTQIAGGTGQPEALHRSSSPPARR